MNARIMGVVFLGVAILVVCGCRDRMAMEKARPGMGGLTTFDSKCRELNTVPAPAGSLVTFPRKCAAAVHGLRKKVNIFFFDSGHSVIYATGQDVPLSAVRDAKGECAKVDLFSVDDKLKVTRKDNGEWTMQLGLVKKGAHIEREMVEGKGPGGTTGWLQPKAMRDGEGSATWDPNNYDYYVMLRDNSADPTLAKVTKHYRVEAFPASSWDGSNCKTACDCERPEHSELSDRVENTNGEGQTHSGEGDERH